ncbi:hypothetical protein SAMN05428945_5130 [Streptomyces sp. 2224.1]|uniref:hypothetical protein n=1 Tax=unclassified Streptomyces TaxID=2593676 RepID=UPI0008962D4A|nr:MULTISPECIES: hypothetical protein [unclassified Streptomyces]SED51484.1 hypothetical protein SAMN05428945_5130 [Streptomyces sp. 2224.1]SEF17835.1 hypothetical protein SAMN05428954_7072 [Streptomyces sp. 2112.3]
MAFSSLVRKGTRTVPFLLAIAGIGVAVVVGMADAGPTTPAEPAAPRNPFLAEVAAQIDLPARAWTASGTHTARGYTTEAAETIGVEGMKADCDNINLNKKLAADFRSDVFGPGVKGFFYKCRRVSPDTNKYWFTISSADHAQIDKLCDPHTRYPVVHDEQHDTYWIDEPFTCTRRADPS